jgi:hypothetical protein
MQLMHNCKVDEPAASYHSLRLARHLACCSFSEQYQAMNFSMACFIAPNGMGRREHIEHAVLRLF